MSLQRCLACNTQVSKSCKICVCGHVFEDMKQIGGKRFSGYRAQLYLRLESKRMQVLTGNKRDRNSALLPRDERHLKEGNRERVKLSEEKEMLVSNHEDEKSTYEHKPKRFRRSTSLVQTKPTPFNPKERDPVPAEMIDRLPKALEEINKRILVQNLMWIGL